MTRYCIYTREHSYAPIMVDCGNKALPKSNYCAEHKPPKKFTISIHFNKRGATKDKPWTVHYRGKCLLVNEVKINVPVRTVFMPNKQSNPRAWMKCEGFVHFDKHNVAYILESPNESY